MKTTILILLLGTLCNTQDFNQYIAKFHKHYKNVEERIRRQAIYMAKWEQIKANNAENKNYKAGENIYTDRTPQEIQRMAGLYNFVFANQPTTNPPHRKLRSSATVPLQVDWRVQGKVSSVKNQGSCGSCWVFTTAALYESHLMIGGYTPEPDLSEQYILECTTANSPNVTSDCNGGILEYSIPFVVQTGVPPESAYPYLAANWLPGNATPVTPGICDISNASTIIKQGTLNGTYQGSYSNLTQAQMQEIISYAPVTAAIYANSAFMSYSSGVFTGCPDFNTSVANLNHAVLVVGYDQSGNYIIKNSWDTAWGENGYATISKTNDCGISYGPRQIRGLNQALVASQSYQSMLMLAISVFCIIVMLII